MTDRVPTTRMSDVGVALVGGAGQLELEFEAFPPPPNEKVNFKKIYEIRWPEAQKR